MKPMRKELQEKKEKGKKKMIGGKMKLKKRGRLEKKRKEVRGKMKLRKKERFAKRKNERKGIRRKKLTRREQLEKTVNAKKGRKGKRSCHLRRRLRMNLWSLVMITSNKKRQEQMPEGR